MAQAVIEAPEVDTTEVKKAEAEEEAAKTEAEKAKAAKKAEEKAAKAEAKKLKEAAKALFGIFTAHVTGNIALAGSSFVSSDGETTITRLLMLPTFILTVALTSLLARYARRKKWSVFAVFLTAEAIALVIFLIVGTNLSPALVLDVQEEYISEWLA